MAKQPVDVLIIEDLVMMMYELERMVVALGHRVVGLAKTQQEAVHLAKQLKPSLIISGVNLGAGGSGIAAVEQIKRELDVPVVFVTAQYEKALKANLVDPSCVVAKPLTYKQLSAAVSSALHGAPHQS